MTTPREIRQLQDATLCVAPMMAWTDRHCRYLHRLYAPNTLLFTEMVTANALLHAHADRLLRYNPEEHPLALQLGGSEPEALAAATRLAAAKGFDEINLNVGCPSDRVQRGRFGACLMKEPVLVAHCIRAMQAVTPIPITVKCRLGVDDHDSDELLHAFVGTLVDAGLKRLYLHARKAILKGLSPAQNRQVPPLQYNRAYRVASAFPELEVIINGGITDASAALQHYGRADGIMIGRAAYQHPALIHALDRLLFGTPEVVSADEPDPTRIGDRYRLDDLALQRILNRYRNYMTRELDAGTRLGDLCRPLHGVFHARPGARHSRRALSDHQRLARNDLSAFDDAVRAVRLAA
ncbi:MAG: tRNA dihydrouridine(20/20a) synthase DusA [Pseudomonadota bacterium]